MLKAGLNWHLSLANRSITKDSCPQKPLSVGNHVDSAGIKVISSSAPIKAIKNGGISLIRAEGLMFTADETTKIRLPTGGVVRPNVRFTITIIAK